MRREDNKMIWTHSICESCWNKREPGRKPRRMRDADLEPCCFCGVDHTSGIYVRENPDNVKYCMCEE